MGVLLFVTVFTMVVYILSRFISPTRRLWGSEHYVMPSWKNLEEMELEKGRKGTGSMTTMFTMTSGTQTKARHMQGPRSGVRQNILIREDAGLDAHATILVSY
jgi:hypothetical protein